MDQWIDTAKCTNAHSYSKKERELKKNNNHAFDIYFDKEY